MKITSEEALKRLSRSQQTFTKLFQHGSLLIEIYKPHKVDLQEPHDQDEVYIIISGSGTFVRGTQRTSFTEGDLLFAPAGQSHYFEDFTDDFRTWVIFYGPKGGESSTTPSS
ncbi:MAG: cupin domain-containing protein [Bacteroidota bacterium]